MLVVENIKMIKAQPLLLRGSQPSGVADMGPKHSHRRSSQAECWWSHSSTPGGQDLTRWAICRWAKQEGKHAFGRGSIVFKGTEPRGHLGVQQGSSVARTGKAGNQ